MQIPQTLLFVPGNKPQMFKKSLTYGADMIILDLEDAVSPNEKDEARKLVYDFFEQEVPHLQTNTKIALRTNTISSASGRKDLEELRRRHIQPDWYVHPKTENADQVKKLERYFGDDTQMILMIESMAGFVHLHEIAGAGTLVRGFAFGGADFTNDSGLHYDWEAMYFYRSNLVMQAKAHDLFAIDSPYFNYKDSEGLRVEMQRLKNIGFAGRLLIHPSQIEVVRSVMLPTEKELQEARGIKEAFEAAGGNVCQYNGKMIDEPIYKKALRVLGA